MENFLHALDAGHYDTWLLILYWFAAMAVVWPGIVRVILWWQREQR